MCNIEFQFLSLNKPKWPNFMSQTYHFHRSLNSTFLVVIALRVYTFLHIHKRSICVTRGRPLNATRGAYLSWEHLSRIARTSAPRVGLRTVFVLYYPQPQHTFTCHLCTHWTNIYNGNHQINTLASRTDLSSTSGHCSASHADRFVSQTNGRLPVTRGQFLFQRNFLT
jgi:hypothetical protein